TCAVPTGTITITSATAGLTFSIDGGAYAAYPAGGYIVGSGPHTISAQNAAVCISPAVNATVAAAPVAPTAPTLNVVDPTCAVATGTITITSATAGLTFSIDGGAYAAYPAGGYTVGAGPHTISAQNAAGCTSADATATAATAPGAPATPVTQTVDPTCTVATGTITITSATAGLTFSFDGGAFGPYPAGGYINILPGPHTITVDNGSGCTTVVDVPVAAVPAIPTTPTLNVVDPTCAVATGTITITSATAGLTFSIDGGAYAAYPAGGYTVGAGPHTISAQNAAGCISADATATAATAPGAPAIPVTQTVDPTCTVATGAITITSATAGLTFSFDGGAFGPYPAGGYINILPGPHTI